MPFRTLKLLPGVNLEQTPTLNKAYLAASNLIRFYGGLVQKLGGWLQLTAQTLIGTCRGLHGWADIVGNPYLAAGTEQRLTVFIGGSLYDITPVTATSNVAVAFTTKSTSKAVTIKDASNNPNENDWINLQTQVSVGGIVLFGDYTVSTVVDGTHYTITAASAATASVTDGGAVPAYTTTKGSGDVSVQLASHGLIAGSLFDAAVSTTVAAVVIDGIYSVKSKTDANNFVITASPIATSSTSASENSGNARIQYLLPTGYAVDTPLTGYGVGDYGLGDYGEGGSGQIIAPMRQWSLDHWGQDLIASPSGGGIYYWTPPDPVPATVMPNAPIYNTAVFVMAQVQIAVALGAEISSTQEPLLIRWSDAGDFTAWTATATNQAGSYQITGGSMIVGGLAVGLGALVWTDQDLWSMTYSGLPFVFGFNRIAPECGLVAQRAAGAVGGLVMWLGLHQFFRYGGGDGVKSVECSVWDFYWNNTDQTQLGQYHCAINANFNEMAWHFPLATTSPLWSALAPMAYIKYNYIEDCWDYGLSSQYQRTAWVGHSPIGSPVGADLDGLLQQHELGYDANGVGMQWSWTTGGFDLAEGEEFVFVDLLIPDSITVGSPTINYTVTAANYPNAPPITVGPFPVTPTTPFVPLRIRGHQISIGASGSDLGTFNRLGAMRYRTAPDGRNA